jgi:subtilisin family serine protease
MTRAKKRSAKSSRLRKPRPASTPVSILPAGPPASAAVPSEPGAGPVTDPKILAKREESHGERIQSTLIKTAIALPLLDKLDDGGSVGAEFDVIIDANLDYPMGRTAARDWILSALAVMLGTSTEDRKLRPGKNLGQNQYVFATLPAWVIRGLVSADASGEVAPLVPSTAGSKLKLPGKPMPPAVADPAKVRQEEAATVRAPRAVYQIWEDFRIQPLISATISTVKADAARAAFRAAGAGIVWAVVDSGIEVTHPHFALHRNLLGQVEAWHRDFTGDAPIDAKTSAGQALTDGYGHGTHVAGIVAGEIAAYPPPDAEKERPDIIAYQRMLSPDSPPGEREIIPQRLALSSICGMAPRTKLVSLRVLDEQGRGQVSNIIAALNWVQEINGYGRRIRIHGVNLSVGYPFDPEWFACGQSQLCVEVNRLVRSGVTVVVAAGNTGYGTQASDALGARKGGLALTINDPGNADLVITVGATHRDMPHVYGVSYFSAKGPTGDGRFKPDLIAPGEKVISCAAGRLLDEVVQKLPAESARPNYIEYTGTSMAAPHVSGCVAAFLSVKREFSGQPERVKEIFQKTATSLGRERSFEGHGLVDVMRAIQFV